MPRRVGRPGESIATQVARFVPVMPAAHWDVIGGFVRAAVLDSASRTPYTVAELMAATARHVRWCRFMAGLELERSVVFDRRTISLAIAEDRELSPASGANVRAQLLRMAEALMPEQTPARLPVLPAAEPSAPYSLAELHSFRSWAAGQPTSLGRSSAAALVALGAGAGLAARELAAVVPSDVRADETGVLVHVSGQRTRIVPVLHSWEDILLEVRDHTPRGVPLFRPGHGAFYPNIVTNFVARSAGSELKPQSPRLRATWIVALLTTGAPPKALMDAAGISSLEALTRFLRFVPDPDPALARFALRYADVQL